MGMLASKINIIRHLIKKRDPNHSLRLYASSVGTRNLMQSLNKSYIII